MKVNSKLGRYLVAAAVAGSCGYVHAAVVSATSSDYTNAAVNAAGTSADLAVSNLRVQLGAAYTAGNALTVTLQNGAQFSGNADNVASSLKCSSAATSDSDMVLAYQAGGNSGSSAVTYLVQSVSAGQTTSGLNCSFGPRHLLTRSLPTSGVVGASFSAAVSNGGTAIDTAVATATLATARSQFTFGSVSGVVGQIDVTTNRLLFVDNIPDKPHQPFVTALAGAKSADGIQFRTGHLSISASASATQQTFEISFTGDFNFVNDDGGICSVGDLTGGAGTIVARQQRTAAASADASARLSISENCGTLTYKVSPANAATDALTALTGNEPTNVVHHTISLQRATSSTGLQWAVGSYGYTAPVFGTYGTTPNNGGGSASTNGAGSFTSNGLTVDVPYVPFGNAGTSTIGHVFVWNNRSSQSSTVSVSAYKAGSTTPCATNLNLATITANTVTNISDQVRTYVAGCFPADYTATSGPRVSLRFEANLPASTNELYTSFTIGSDRALVPNSSTGRGAPRSN
jgi:hypothetical protein